MRNMQGASYDYEDREGREEQGDEVTVRCIMRVPGEPDKTVMARMPAGMVPNKRAEDEQV